MFKKTLLALTVASLSCAANAGTIYPAVTDSVITAADFTVTPAAAEALGADGALAGGDDNCDVAATDLSVTLGNTGNGEGGNNDAVSNANQTGIFDSATSVTMDGAGTCDAIQADVITTAPISSSIEAAQNTLVPVTASLVAGIGGYDVGDTLTFNLTGATIDTANSPAPTLTSNEAGIVINVLDITTTTVRFTVDATSNKVSGLGILNLGGVNLDATGLSTSTEVSLSSFATNTSGTQFDVTAAAVVADLVPQYSTEVTTAMDGVIDVSLDRQSLEDVGATDTAGTGEAVDNDTLVLTTTLDATGTTVTPSTITFTFGGDFTWLETVANTSDDSVAATDAEVLLYLDTTQTAAFLTGGTDDAMTAASLNEDMDELTITASAGSNVVDGTHTFIFEVPGQADTSPVLVESDYTVNMTVNDATASPNTITMNAGTVDAGAWTLNGSVVTIPYMPFDDNTAVILRHTNTGVQTGDVSVRYMLEGVSSDWVSVGVVTSSSRGVQNIRDAVMNAITADAGVDSGKVAIEITTNVPSADVTVYAAYKVRDEQDRGFVGTFGQHGSAQ
ncbi:hypothetical protein [Thalassomonas haliotis]|uniref:Uncharacterized protein n=1 Tax=Thalassomonas haliotis TaxID=485448 RepID=A0ABY7VID4_9GAMM|nr:hypothetical protein [Thalassomonas haliotis]WDE13273.1 hypothetical protein H3N35_07490 [Thalassomonas haliotis]